MTIENNIGEFTLGYAIANRASFVQDAVNEIIEKDNANGNPYLNDLLAGNDTPTLLLSYNHPNETMELILTSDRATNDFRLLATFVTESDASYFSHVDVSSVVEGIEKFKEYVDWSEENADSE